jgi:non-haem Fe2+, alpha-ketoglutarate-dependent halogenase
MTANSLSQRQIADYRQNGYVYPVAALSAEEASSYMSAIEQFEQKTGEKAVNTIRGKGHLKLLALYELTRHPRILDAVESLIGPDILCWNSSLFLKEPHDPAYVAWHQDVYDFDTHSDGVVSAWIALLPSTVDNGAMRVIPGSQKNRHVPHVTSPPGAATMLRDQQEIGVDVDEAQAVNLVLERGQMSFHHMYLYHGSPPNRSNGRRCGFAVRYVAPHVCKRGDPYSATLVRGVDAVGHFGKDPVPKRDLDPAVVEFVACYGKPRLPK